MSEYVLSEPIPVLGPPHGFKYVKEESKYQKDVQCVFCTMEPKASRLEMAGFTGLTRRAGKGVNFLQVFSFLEK